MDPLLAFIDKGGTPAMLALATYYICKRLDAMTLLLGRLTEQGHIHCSKED